MALIIRLTPEDEKLIEKLKSHLYLQSASKALLEAARLIVDELVPIKGQLRQANTDLADVKAEYDHLKRMIRDRASIDQQIAIKCYQGHPGSRPGTEENCNHSSALEDLPEE